MLMGVLLPEQAFAWGPGVHMVTGNWILQNLSVLPLPVSAALMLHPGQFLHGSLSADIFIGKGCRPKKGHSHNWESGFALLGRAETPQQRSYAYGYLAHLAADTVAHNVFVPGLAHTIPAKGKMAHVYLEIQADRLLSWDSSDAVGVFHERSSRKAAAMLRATMRQRTLSFWLKTRLFESSVALGGSRAWRGSLRVLDSLVPGHERSALLDRMLTLSTRAIVNLLQEGEASPVLTLDPIGAEALANAEKHGRDGLLAQSLATRFKRVLPGAPRNAAPTPEGEPALTIPVPPVLETFPPVCTSDGMIR